MKKKFTSCFTFPTGMESIVNSGEKEQLPRCKYKEIKAVPRNKRRQYVTLIQSVIVYVNLVFAKTCDKKPITYRHNSLLHPLAIYSHKPCNVTYGCAV